MQPIFLRIWSSKEESLSQAFLAETVETGDENGDYIKFFCEESFGKINTKDVELDVIAHVRYIKILTWLRGCRVKIANFSRLHRLAISRRIERKENQTNRKMTRETRSHVRILIFERGLLKR